MAPVSFIDDAITACSAGELEASTTSALQKPAMCVSLPSPIDVADDGATTDIGHSSASETESSSGMSSNEGCRTLNRRCRFGKTSLETIPATPSAATMPLHSPPGFSRSAMREARDACTHQTDTVTLDMQNSSSPVPTDTLASSGAMLSKFANETAFGTVPKTPVGKAKLKSLKSVFGSPPGLSHTQKRQARDACKGPEVAPPSWGNHEVLSTGPSTGDSKRGVAHDKLVHIKDNAARLQQLKSRNEADTNEQEATVQESLSEPEIEEGLDAEEKCERENACAAAPEDKSEAKLQNCRFHGSALGTLPSTPASKDAAVMSPPGLSRKAALRQARDTCKTAPTSWGAGNSTAFTISPAGKPMTPPAQRAARQRAARDAMALGWGGLVPAAPKAAEVPR
jgi:hypothetical protein